jgi:death-on-curing protein
VTEPIWLPTELVLSIHERQLRRYGGPPGVRDLGALESALGRHRNRWAYEDGDLPSLAAAYAFGIACNHPFLDGNKRAALLALVTFLGLNGIDFVVDEASAAVIIRDLAAGSISEESLARWIRDNLPLA